MDIMSPRSSAQGVHRNHKTFLNCLSISLLQRNRDAVEDAIPNFACRKEAAAGGCCSEECVEEDPGILAPSAIRFEDKGGE